MTTMTIEALMAKKTEYEQALAEYGKEAITGEFQAFFEENPKCVGIRWDQYTPYFNDGEECVFRVNVDYGTIRMQDTPEDAGDHEDGYEDDYGGSAADKARKSSAVFKKAQKGMQALGRKIGNDVFRIAFGDHVSVTATREGFDVEEYEHE